MINRNSLNRNRNRRGAMLVFIAVALVIFVVVMVFSIDIARMHLVRAELRLATDAGARAGAEALSREQDTSKAVDAAIRIAAKNFVGGKPLELTSSDVQLGSAVEQAKGNFVFSPTGDPINAVKVTGDPGNVQLYLGSMLGRESFRPTLEAVAIRLDRDIAIALDSSGSMAAHGRFRALEVAFAEFLSVLENANGDDYLSLTDYDTRSRLVQSVTKDLDLVRDGFEELRVGGATAIGDGILTASNSLRGGQSRSHALKTIIVMTDGRQNRGANPLTTATIAQNRGHTVHTITFGQGADQTLMRQVAERGGGIHLHANNNAELVEKFREIALQLPVLLTE